jgi:hypothetical protein
MSEKMQDAAPIETSINRKDYTIPGRPKIEIKTMRITAILAHPRPGSFNHAIAEAALETLQRNGHEVAFHDLYLESFDPVLLFEEIPKGSAINPTIQRHCDEISQAKE